MRAEGRAALSVAVLAAVDRLPLRMRRQALFLLFQHRIGRFGAPRTFSEKVNWRILNDHREDLSWTCDKLAMKQRADTLGVRYPETYWTGRDIRQMPIASMPTEWVLKPNHRSGLVYFGNAEDDPAKLALSTAGWLEDREWQKKGEWAYSKAAHLFIAEQNLSREGVAPTEYKFFVFNGETVIVTADVDRFGDHRRTFYDAGWNLIEGQCAYPSGPAIARPDTLEEMLRAASAVAAGLDFLRVDLYSVEGSVYLGEVTPYPAGGLDPIRPYSLDSMLGSRWELPAIRSAR